MTILLVSHTADLNGAEKSLLELAVGLKKHTIECMVLCPNKGILVEELRKANIDTYIIDMPRPQRDWLGVAKFFLFWLPTVLKIYRFLIKRDVSIVYNNTIDGLYSPFAARLANIPCIWHVREVKPKSKRIRVGFTWLLTTFANTVVFNSNATRVAYSASELPNWYVVYNGVEVSEKAVSKRSKKNLTVGFAGQMVLNKQPKRFVDVFDLANKATNNITGVMAGDGPMLVDVKTFIKDKGLSQDVRVLGRVENMRTFFENIDIFVLTSDAESFGRVIIEAMSNNCPVIAANIGGVSEVVEDKVTGFLVSANDIQAYAEKIVTLAENNKVRIGMGRAGYERVKKHFSISNYVEQMISIFKRHE